MAASPSSPAAASAPPPIPFAAFEREVAAAASPLRAAVTAAYRRDETLAVQALQQQIAHQPAQASATRDLAQQLVQAVRAKRGRASGVDALMHEFSLSSEEGVALMCLAEALLRIPDHQTADRLIADKISRGDWRRHLGESPSLFVNAATWGLLITGKLVATSSEQGLGAALNQLIAKGGEPLIRKGVDLAMRMLGNQFVSGQTIAEALANSRANEARGYRYSYDMLGEAALTAVDAARYYADYETAIHAIGRAAHGRGIHDGPGISVKLSALHPRYSRAQRARVMDELLPRLQALLLLARQYDIGLNLDAEEAERLELSLDLMEALAFDPALAGFDGIGFVVQAYQKRAPFVIDYLADLAQRSGHRFMLRLVKGAYWDSEIKRAQEAGLPGYPVYTRKLHTDLSYLLCAHKLLGLTAFLYPQFATHNAQSLAAIYTEAQARGVTDYEFQCLYGMGETLYDQVVGAARLGQPCRIYAPVGSHQTLLAYLVRRLLENGANSSFVNQLVDAAVPLAALVADPVEALQRQGISPHPQIPLPGDLYGSERRNAAGLDFSDEDQLRCLSTQLHAEFSASGPRQWQAQPLLEVALAAPPEQTAQELRNPADRRDLVGTVRAASAEHVAAALASASTAAAGWQARSGADRAAILRRGADLFEHHRTELMALAVREAGKSLPNALAEVREAVDFLRYYAAQIEREMPGTALGVVACISPWNFPLAIFTGQVSAALAAGNAVLAKPAEQTPLIAYRAVQLLQAAGVPRAVLQLLPGAGETVGAALVADARVAGVIFTGSTEVAQHINRSLAQRGGESGDIPLVAETGGQNALIVDSSALPEQVVQDALVSAFDSAGQRCSALRVLCLQTDIADATLAMLKGALQESQIGNPDRLATDIGPVIDAEAQHKLVRHIDAMRAAGHRVEQLPLPASTRHGSFVAPTVIEIEALAQLPQEVFGPVLHVLRYRREQLPQLVEAINASGYGLTLGIHSRIDETIAFISHRARVGNIYVNRNLIGAVVGVQPFGGEGKSGTGPKAGGPLYLQRLQRQATVNWSGHIIHAAVDSRAFTASPHPPATPNPALEAWLAWLQDHGYQRCATLAEQYAHGSPLGTSLLLPGPTGERNSLWFAPRGAVLCAAASVDALLNQLAAVLATGNRAVVPVEQAALLPAAMPALVRARIELQDAAGREAAPLTLALLATERAAWRSQLAARTGALVPVVETAADLPIPLWRLVAERALCINTTAAGGNASLMMLSG